VIKALSYGAPLGIAAGIGLILQPWWTDGFRVGFFVTAGFTVLHIVVTHIKTGERR